MNLPNKLTTARIVLTPIFMAAMVFEFPYHYFVALVFFIVASITDYLDGNIARKQGIVTNFGKFLDPLADKMLTTSAFLGFLFKGRGFGIVWVLFIVLFREFMIASLRLVAVSSESKKVIPANYWGKTKTVFQMVAIIFGLVLFCFESEIAVFVPVADTVIAVGDIIFSVLLWVSTALAVISGAIYLKNSYGFINGK